MNLKNYKKKRIYAIYILFIIILSSFPIISIFQVQRIHSNNKFEGSEFKNPQVAAQETLTAVWLENPTFEDPIEPVWYSELEGDLKDVEATASLGQVNMKVIGDSRDMIIDEALSSTNWNPYNNPDLPILPDTYVINSSGCYLSHLWHEDQNQTRNRPSVHWKRVITMPVNMSDYIITSASLEVIFNATVSVSPHAGTGGGIDRLGDVGLDRYSSGDSADFYVLLNNEEETLIPTPIATNNTGAGNLGQDTPAIGSFSDSQMDIIPESVLIDALTSVLSSDGRNFTITLGIDIYCEDNEVGVDVDRWNSLIIKSFNLTFRYEKKIKQFSSISWNQDGGQISDVSNDTVIVNEAKLNFKYRIDNNWTSSSPNSEIRAYINTNKIPETIKLDDATTTFKEAKIGGFDVTSLIPYNTDINFSIQVYLADEFSLDRNATISIDDVYLNITYTVIFPDFQTNLQIFFNGVNKTSNPIYDHPVGNNLNITVKYPDDSGTHITGAVVQLYGNITGTLTEDPTNEQYTIIIDSNDLNVGTFNFKVVAHKINFELSTINPILTIIPTETQNLHLFLNGVNKSLDPLIDVPLDGILNITVKFSTLLGTPVTGATVTLFGEGLLEPLNESSRFNHYSVIINSTIKLRSGINLLKIEANRLNFEEQVINPRITVRKIISVITGVNNTNSMSIHPGDDANIKVFINNTDFNEFVKGAYVTFSWEGGEDGIFQDLDNDGIYEVDILAVPAGTHTIEINAIGSDKYSFISLEFIIVASRPIDSSLLFQILLTVGVIASIALGGYLYAYHKVLKFPKIVRKVRKYRKSLKRTKAPRISVQGREKAFNSAYRQELHHIARYLKVRPKKEKETEEKPVKESPQSLKPDIATEPKNQNLNVNKIEDINKNKSKKVKFFGIQYKIRLRKIGQGILNIKKQGKSFYALIIIVIIIFSSMVILPLFNQSTFIISDTSTNTLVTDNIRMAGQASYTKQWLNNTSFDPPIEPTWYHLYGELGDPSDVKAIPDIGQVNYTILGDSGIMRIDDPLNGIDWTPFNNPIYPISPDVYGVNSTGCYIAHTWDEGVDQSRNTPSMQWKRNVTMPVNMSDYIITSASIEVIFNASVQALDHDGGGVEVDGDYTEGNPSTVPQFGIGDSVTFYAQISDLDNSFPYPIASNTTTNLGQDSPVVNSHPDTPMVPISEDILKSYLKSVLSTDGYNFTITLGIDIYCEDNEYNVDIDRWRRLIIRSFNLTFSYERKIDQFTSISWNQDADKISDVSNNTVIVDEALLNFKYKIDQNWPTSSPNSELRIFINNNQHPETVKLSSATTSFQEGKIGGFDVTSLIIDDVNLSIEMFIADEFNLDKNITISIDDVILNISYTIIFPDKETELHLFLDSANKTDDPDFDIFIGESLNITVKYLNTTGAHIPNATVQLSGNFTADLGENSSLEQYTTVINTDISDAGVNFLTIIAQAEDHETKVINLILRINKFPTENLHVILNNQNVTHDPFIELTISDILNVTLKYNLLNGTHIPGANILLVSETFTSFINESDSFEQYSILIDTNQSLKIGTNFLSVTAQTESLQTKVVDITVSVKRINIEIEPYSGTNTIQTRTGSDVLVRIRLNNIDFGGFIMGAFVTYRWEGRVGILEDLNSDGIYEAIIPNVPDGTSSLEISAFIGDNYFADDYEIIIAATSELTPENPIFPVLFAVSMIVIGGLAIYLYAYQAFLKYPKQVRKVRKYRKSLKQKTAPNIPIIGREAAFKTVYNENLGKPTSDIKLKRHPGTIKTKVKDATPDKVPEKPLEQERETDQLTEKAIEKKEELDELVKDSPKEAK